MGVVARKILVVKRKAGWMMRLIYLFIYSVKTTPR